jgi:hypothetical protein
MLMIDTEWEKIFIYFRSPLQVPVVLMKKSECWAYYNSLKLLAKVETLWLATNNTDGETKLCSTLIFLNEFFFIRIKVQWSIIIIKYFYFNIISGQFFYKI